jgi:hypothetical protein
MQRNTQLETYFTETWKKVQLLFADRIEKIAFIIIYLSSVIFGFFTWIDFFK